MANVPSIPTVATGQTVAASHHNDMRSTLVTFLEGGNLDNDNMSTKYHTVSQEIAIGPDIGNNTYHFESECPGQACVPEKFVAAVSTFVAGQLDMSFEYWTGTQWADLLSTASIEFTSATRKTADAFTTPSLSSATGVRFKVEGNGTWDGTGIMGTMYWKVLQRT